MALDMERSPMSELSDDLLIEIISLVPYKSNCCCKCVSRRWRDLITHPDHRKKLPRSTLAGFFYGIDNSIHHSDPHVYHGYQSVSGDFCLHVDTSLSFLPKCKILGIYLLHCCNGLLLSQRWERKSYAQQVLDYVVCNPATEKWVSVPATEWSSDALDARLGFDPAVSSHFHLFEFATTADETGKSRHIKVVSIYSSKAGAWTHRSAWDRPIEARGYSAGAFFDGAMYFASYADMVVAVVDVEGNCRVIPMPTSDDSVDSGVYLSQGKLYLVCYGASQLSVWALEDSTSGENWTLKHNVSHLQLFGQKHSSYLQVDSVFIHPEENVIFIMCMGSYTGGSRLAMKLMSYDMDSRELRPIRDLELGAVTPFFEYVPFFSGPLADGN